MGFQILELAGGQELFDLPAFRMEGHSSPDGVRAHIFDAPLSFPETKPDIERSSCLSPAALASQALH